MGRVERVLATALRWNNASIAGHAAPGGNPWPLDAVDGLSVLSRRRPTIAAEWTAFVAGGGRLPTLDDVLDESQGADGTWRAGLLVHDGKPVRPLASHFPETIAALGCVRGLRAALWSVLEAGAELPEHLGPNAGVLRYHLGIDCGDGAGLRVGDAVVPYRDGEAVLFDDTVPHAAWNRGTGNRVTLFCEVLRPLRGHRSIVNRGVQRLLVIDERYRLAPRRAAAWHVEAHRSDADR